MEREKFEVWLEGQDRQTARANMARSGCRTKADFVRRSLVSGAAPAADLREALLGDLGLAVNRLVRLAEGTGAENRSEIRSLLPHLRKLMRELTADVRGEVRAVRRTATIAGLRRRGQK